MEIKRTIEIQTNVIDSMVNTVIMMMFMKVKRTNNKTIGNKTKGETSIKTTNKLLHTNKEMKIKQKSGNMTNMILQKVIKRLTKVIIIQNQKIQKLLTTIRQVNLDQTLEITRKETKTSSGKIISQISLKNKQKTSTKISNKITKEPKQQLRRKSMKMTSTLLSILLMNL